MFVYIFGVLYIYKENDNDLLMLMNITVYRQAGRHLCLLSIGLHIAIELCYTICTYKLSDV